MTMIYANGRDPERKVHPAGTQPEPPKSSRSRDNEGFASKKRSHNRIPLHENLGIDYTNFAKSASRRGMNEYFHLDEETKMPVPLDAYGFFRVSPMRSSDDSVRVAYRIRKTEFILWSKELSSLEVPKPADREFTHEDILSAALKLSEIRKEEIDRAADLTKAPSSNHKLFGDYPSLKSKL